MASNSDSPTRKRLKLCCPSSKHPVASTSASLSVQRSFKYDVFLSFRGEDTRKTFVDHLYHALVNKGILTYKDDEKIDKGEMISEQLIRSIEESRFYIIVLSKNYASSSWCLDELVKIMECQRTTEQTAYPVFYDVEPTEVRNQSGAVGVAFEKYEENEDAGRWRVAMKEAASLAGWDLKNTNDGHEAKLIQNIVQEILLKPHFINSSIDGKLVGMETRVKKIVSSLELDSDDVRMIGIKGMGGGGKTTLARAVYDHVSIWFEGNSFVENVRESSKGFGLKNLQKQILSTVLNDQSIDVTGVLDGKHMMKRRMGNRKVIIVLDDVDHIDQLEALASELTWFKPGSRIIITTRDEQVLVAHQVNYIHDISLLSHEEAICLFGRYAVNREISSQMYEELSREVVHYAAGLPLTIKVLGSFLNGRIERQWKDAIERLKTIPLKETLEKLEISYDGLENDYKEIFLEVACILKGETEDYAIKVLESLGFRAEIGLRVLEQKSLISISDKNTLELHDHIEEMGMNIVRRLHPNDPNKHSRLWIGEEIEEILINESGTEATKSINLKYTSLCPATIMKGLRNMKELRRLDVVSFRNWNIDAISQYLPDALRYLDWYRYPFRCLPETFRADNLVNLVMKSSKMSRLCEGGEKKVLNKLRFLDLSYSKLYTFDFGMAPNLEELNLNRCQHFVKLKMRHECPNLRYLDLTGSKVRSLNLELTPRLETLNLRKCKNFVKLNMPHECPKLKVLNLKGSNVSSLKLGLTPHLETLDLDECNDFVELNMPHECPKLKFLNLSGSKVSSLNLGLTPHIEELDLVGCNEFVDLNMPHECLKLRVLNLSGSKMSSLNLGLTPHLQTLDLRGCSDFSELNIPHECPKLISLNLNGSKVSSLNLGLTPHIKKLYLGGCADFVHLNIPYECPKLQILDLSNSKLNKLRLGLTPHLKELDLEGCNDLVELNLPHECPKLISLNLSGSKISSLNLGLTPHIEKLNLGGCHYLQDIHARVGFHRKLIYLNLSGCLRFEGFFFGSSPIYNFLRLPGGDFVTTFKLTAKSLDICPLHPDSNLLKIQFNDESLPSESGNIEKLLSFGICPCTNRESFSAAICSLQHLRKLKLEVKIPEVPKDLGQIESLEELTLLMKDIKHLPDSICLLKHLKVLELESCWRLEKLPKDLGRLECLEMLELTNCRYLRDLPNDICNMKSLRYLGLRNCVLVEKLPEELGRLKCLKILDIQGAGVGLLPRSIYQLTGLCIIGSWWRLRAYGFTSLSKTSTSRGIINFCYIT